MGKLPITFYETLDELPEFINYSMKGRTYRYMDRKAQYPFGFGLNYGKVSVIQAEYNENNTVRAILKNEGKYDTEEVVQVYVKSEDSEYAVPNPQLCGFKRVFLKAGDNAEVELTLFERAFTVVDDLGNRFVPGGRYKLYVGCGQPDEKTRELTGTAPIELTILKSACGEK